MSRADSNRVVYGYKGYTELELGNVNLLISVPHDGSLRPVEIPDRVDPYGNIRRDSNTRNFTQILKDELSTLFSSFYGYNIQMFVIYNNLHRIKMDPNRSKSEGCCASDEALKAYEDYHSMIQSHFRAFVHNERKSYKQALLIDIHGQAHPENRIELGYGIGPALLNKDHLCDSYTSSLHSLFKSSPFCLESMVRGNVSMGSVLNKYGLAAIPSPQDPKPLSSNYYVGGFISRYHSGLADPATNINCIQIELPSSMRSNSSYSYYARVFAKAVFEFYKIHAFCN